MFCNILCNATAGIICEPCFYGEAAKNWLFMQELLGSIAIWGLLYFCYCLPPVTLGLTVMIY